jgi:hypothetical protein
MRAFERKRVLPNHAKIVSGLPEQPSFLGGLSFRLIGCSICPKVENGGLARAISSFSRYLWMFRNVPAEHFAERT